MMTYLISTASNGEWDLVPKAMQYLSRLHICTDFLKKFCFSGNGIYYSVAMDSCKLHSWHVFRGSFVIDFLNSVNWTAERIMCIQ